jgi:hypothetical protein
MIRLHDGTQAASWSFAAAPDFEVKDGRKIEKSIQFKIKIREFKIKKNSIRHAHNLKTLNLNIIQ